MKIKCNKSYSFHIYDSNKCKTDLLCQKSEKIRTFKNNLSNIFIIEDIINSKFDALKKYNIQIEGLSGQEIQIAIAEVHDFYSNKLDNYKNLLKVEIQKEIIITKCGHSHSDNRKSQEIFKCIECGFEINADFGDALKIEVSLSVDVLRTGLLNKVEGLYIPKRISKQSIFNILYSYYNIRTDSNINEEMEFS